jgi:hypothetical protein
MILNLFLLLSIFLIRLPKGVKRNVRTFHLLLPSLYFTVYLTISVTVIVFEILIVHSDFDKILRFVSSAFSLAIINLFMIFIVVLNFV